MRPRPARRTVLAGVAGLLGSLAGCPDSGGDGDGAATTGGDGSPTTDGSGGPGGLDVSVGSTPVATGLRTPVDVLALDREEYLVAEQAGRIVHVADGERQTALDLRDSVVDVSGYDERGLLGLAHHPDFERNGRLFVRYSAPSRQGTPDGYSHTFVLAEFAVDLDDLPADPDSEQTILEIPQPQANHNAGDVVFGPEGLLYVPVGDGGAAGDRGQGHVSDWYDPVPGGNGQDVTENLLGSLLRIDLDDTDGVRPYGIPDDNPLVGREGADEHYAWGLRNPWRLSVCPDGRLFVADVGQNRFEEVNIVERGGNYGWNVREGTACFGAAECPTVTPDGERLRDPIVQYGHGDDPVSGIAVVGGYRYDGTAVADLEGHYVFGDWQSRGRLFVAQEVEEGQWPTAVASIESGDPGPFLTSFGREPDGELLICTTGSATVGGSGGAIHRITEA